MGSACGKPNAVRPSSPDGRWAGTVRSSPTSLEECYTLHNKVGSGAFGTIYRATRTADGQCYAIKCGAGKAALEANDSLVEEVDKWVELSAQRHPSILELLEVIQVVVGDGLQALPGVHLVTELLQGDLMSVLDQIAFSEQACRMVVLQIASAIAHLHLRCSFAHCDIKPANILCRDMHIEKPGCIKLCDFGFCQRFKSRRAAEFSIPCGTMEYFAPELVATYEASRTRRRPSKVGSPTVGRGLRYGAAVDLCALGCCAYELLVGEPPFLTADDSKQLDAIREGELTFPEGGRNSEPGHRESDASSTSTGEAVEASSFGKDQISPHSKGFIRMLLTRDPKLRMRIEDTLEHPWLQTIDDARLRAKLERALPKSVGRRRETAARIMNERDRARLRLQDATFKIVQVRRLRGGRFSVDMHNFVSRRASATAAALGS